MKSYKRGVIVVLLLLVIVSVVVLLSTSKNVSAQKFKIILPSESEHILYSYVWIAKEKGFFDEEGLDVEMVLNNDDASVSALVSFDQNYPIGVMAIESLFESSNYAPNIVPFMFFLYGTSDTSTYDTHLVVSKSSGIKTVNNLKGKKIRIGHPPTIIALRNILKEANLGMNDVQIDGNSSHQVLDLIRSGDLDAAITYYPTMPVILASGDIDILKKNIFSKYVMDYVPQSFIGVNKDFAEENPEVVKRFLSAMEKVFDYGRENPAELIKAYAKLKTFSASSWILDGDLIEKGAALMPEIPIKELDDFYVEDGKKETIYDVLNEYQDLLLKEGFIDSKADLQTMHDNYKAFSSS